MSCGTQIKQNGRIIGLDFSKKEIDAARRENKILTLDLELSRKCNLRCIYCYADSGIAPSNEITFDEIKDVIDQGIQLGIKKVSIVGGGEPLIYPHFFELIEFINSRGLEQIVFTNGLSITRELAKKLKEYQVSVVMKMNSFKEDVQDFLAGGKHVLSKIMAGYEILREEGFLDDDNLTLGIETVICKQNIDELPTIWRWARERGIIPYFEMLTMQGRAKEYNLAVPIEEIKELFETLLEIDKEFGFEWFPKPPIAGLTCQRNYYAILLTSLGKIQPCTGIDIEVGDIRKQPLKEIIENSEVLNNLRNMPDSLKGPCGSCEHNVQCYGCRGSAYNLTGDYLATDPLCWYHDVEVENCKTMECVK
ncbi:MAG: radical SAM protein [Halanaerobiales bacterium]|nr:radical SAM protein [Halanaerobiales bacterium]